MDDSNSCDDQFTDTSEDQLKESYDITKVPESSFSDSNKSILNQLIIDFNYWIQNQRSMATKLSSIASQSSELLFKSELDLSSSSNFIKNLHNIENISTKDFNAQVDIIQKEEILNENY